MLEIKHFLLNIDTDSHLNRVTVFQMGTPGRNVQQSRLQDQTFMLLQMTGDIPYSRIRLQDLASRLCDFYYQQRGSVTYGMRGVAEELNEMLLKSNASENPDVVPTTCHMTFGVIREGQLFLLHSGPVHSLLVSRDDSRFISDTAISGSGLGLVRNFGVYVSQNPLPETSVLTLFPLTPNGWTPTAPAVSGRINLGNVSQAVVARYSPETLAVFLSIPENPYAAAAEEAGEAAGEKTPALLSAAQAIKTSLLKKKEPEPEDDISEEEKKQSVLEKVFGKRPEPAAEPEVTEKAKPEPFEQPRLVPLYKPKEPELPPIEEELPAAEPAAEAEPEKPPRKPFSLALIVVPLIERIREAGGYLKRSIFSLLQRMLPGVGDEGYRVPLASMLFIAIAIPVIISTISVTIYMNSGKGTQHEDYLVQSQLAAIRAQTTSDPEQRRVEWEAALDFANKAMRFGNSTDAAELRAQAQQGLDMLDGVTRLELKPAVLGNFGANVKISAVAASDTDLYVIDSEQGKAYHLYLTGVGYEFDNAFDCSPGREGMAPGKLVDLVILPPDNRFGMDIAATDARGNLLYCGDGRPPLLKAFQPPAAEASWQNINALTYENGVLYLLDIMDTTGKYVYSIVGDRGDFTTGPKIYFNGQVPYAADAIDIGVDRQGLFMLHNDGTVSKCKFRINDEDETTCESPAMMSDHRGGQTFEGLSMPNTRFSNLQLTAAPDSSVYMLDAQTQTIYHFSLKLNLQRTLATTMDTMNPQYGQPPTAFAISPSRTVFVAYSNQLLFAKMP